MFLFRKHSLSSYIINSSSWLSRGQVSLKYKTAIFVERVIFVITISHSNFEQYKLSITRPLHYCSIMLMKSDPSECFKCLKFIPVSSISYSSLLSSKYTNELISLRTTFLINVLITMHIDNNHMNYELWTMNYELWTNTPD